jgi:hypothetical protein
MFSDRVPTDEVSKNDLDKQDNRHIFTPGAYPKYTGDKQVPYSVSATNFTLQRVCFQPLIWQAYQLLKGYCGIDCSISGEGLIIVETDPP